MIVFYSCSSRGACLFVDGQHQYCYGSCCVAKGKTNRTLGHPVFARDALPRDGPLIGPRERYALNDNLIALYFLVN